MLFTWGLPFLALVARGAAQDDAENLIGVEANRYIVEFAKGTLAKTKREEILASEEGITVLKTFDSTVFSGASLETENRSIDTLRDIPNVIGVWPNSKAYLIAPVKRQVAVQPNAADAHTVHWATGVEKLHKQGILGKGVKVGVVDSGIFYNHSALGGGFGPGFKVAGGWDLVGDGWVAGTAKRPDADPTDEQGHGTHVAGILAGEAPSSSAAAGWTGVAPEASLYAYKVFGGGEGGTDQATLIDAFLRAYREGMDVITCSIGGRGGFANNPWAMVANRIAAEGVVVTIGAGNSGSGGGYYASTGSSAENVLSVAAAEVRRNATGDIVQPSYFTSWGGLYDLSVKPDVTGPGTDIFSTWPGEGNNEFVLLSGTSMATPYIAGVAALYISKHGGRAVHGKGFARDLSMRMISTGESLPWLLASRNADPKYRAPSQQVGGGLVDAEKVVGYKTTLELTKFGLNDTANFRADHEVVVRNGGNETVKYTFDVESWAGFEMLKSFDGRDPAETPRMKTREEMTPSNISVIAPLTEGFELAPGQETRKKIVFEIPSGANETALPGYGGRLRIKGSNGETVAVPIQGLAFDLKEQMQNPFHGTYPWLRSTAAYSNKTTFDFELSSGNQNFPMMFLKTKWGTNEVRWDIYTSSFNETRDWEYPPVPGSRGYIGSATSWASAGRTSSFNPLRHNASDVFPFPETDLARNALTTGGFTTTYYWFGRLGNGTDIVPGNYTMRFAALTPFSDPARGGSWKGLTTKFTILPKTVNNSSVSRRWY